MPHETKEQAQKQAQQLGMNTSQVTKSDIGYFIAPQGLTIEGAKKAYASNRAKGMSKEQAAKIAWSIENKVKGKENE